MKGKKFSSTLLTFYFCFFCGFQVLCQSGFPEKTQNKLDSLEAEKMFLDVLEVLKGYAETKRKEGNLRAHDYTMAYSTWLPYEDSDAEKLIEFFNHESSELAKNHPEKAAYIWSHLAKYYDGQDQLEKSILYYEKAVNGLAIHQDTIDLPWVYYWLGQLVIRQRADGIIANEYADEGIRLRSLRKNKSGSIDARLIGLKGWAHRFIDENKALIYYEQALSVTPESKSYFIFYLQQTVRILINLEQYKKAFAKCEKLLELSPSDPENYALLAQVLTAQGKNIEAISELEKAQEFYEIEHDTINREYYKLYYFKALAYLASNNLEKSTENCQLIYSSFVDQFKPNSLFDFPSIDTFGLDLWVYHALLVHGKTLRKKYLSTNDQQFNIAAIKLFERIFYEVENRRMLMPSWGSKEAFNQFVYSSYHEALSCLTDLYLTEKSQKYSDQFLQIYDRSKSTLFKEKLIYESVSQDFASPEIQKKGDSLQMAMAKWEVKNKNGIQQGDENKNILSKELFEVKQEWKKYLEENYHERYSMLTFGVEITRDSLAKCIDAKTALLGYHVTNEFIYGFYLDSLSFQMNRIPNTKLLKGSIADFRKSVTDWSFILDHTAESKSLLNEASLVISESLLEGWNFPKNISNLVVIQDDFLHNLPFELLINPENKNRLIDDYQISYAHSLSTFIGLKNEPRQKYDKLFAGFAPAYIDDCRAQPKSQVRPDKLIVNRSTLDDIPEARETVQYLAGKWKGDAWIGEDATKQSLLTNKKAYQILHLGMHGHLDSISNELSSLVFSCNQDHLLHLSEIQASNISSDLVVLSACNTGVGDNIIGEGPMSLSRAFFYAGANSTLMSLWPVPDQQTALIMRGFYAHLASGETKSKALQMAKKDYLSSASELEKHPAFWAGFVLFGNDSTIDFNGQSNSTLIVISLVLLLSLILFLFSRKFRTNKRDS